MNFATPPALRAIAALAFFTSALHAGTTEYDLTIEHQMVNFTGKKRPAMTVNGGIPGPVLVFTEGDDAVIRVHNRMKVATSVHWHGILVPPDMDGVPFITFPPIEPGATFVYRFPIRQAGTYWYHSHSGLQEQMGVYGQIVIHPRNQRRDIGRVDQDVPVLFSDWTDESAHEVMRTLRRGSEYYSIKKGSAISLAGAVKHGMLRDFFQRELVRMPEMDISDVYYDRFLANGKSELFVEARPGEIVRLRLVDGSASTFFYAEFAKGPMTIIEADGQPVVPVKHGRLLMGIAETYDVLVTVPRGGAWEFRATSHDATGHASIWIGDPDGERHAAPDVPLPNLYHSMGKPTLDRIFAFTPAGSMGMPDRKVKEGMFDQPGMMMNMPGMKMEGMNHSNMDGMGAMGDMGSAPASNAMPAMDHSKMNMSAETAKTVPEPSGAVEKPTEMDHAKIDHSKMEMPRGEPMPSSSREPSDMAVTRHTGASSMSGMNHSSMQGMDGGGMMMESSEETLYENGREMVVDGMNPKRPLPPYPKLKALHSTAPDPSKPVREIRLTLDGDMDRYVWLLNNKALHESDQIHIKEGEIVRFIMINRTMMYHPMHLHGHFFRIISGQGDRSPLKHTVTVMPMATTVFEFEANEVGDWFFHCHLLYHMHSGMARVVEYDDFAPAPETAAVRDELFKVDPYFYGAADGLSHMTEGYAELAGIRYSAMVGWEIGWGNVKETEYEIDLTANYFHNRFLSLFGGAELTNGDEYPEARGIFGYRYPLPFLVHTFGWVDSEGEFRFGVQKSYPITQRLHVFGELEYDTRTEYEWSAGLEYILGKNVSLTGNYHSEFGTGGGLTIRF